MPELWVLLFAALTALPFLIVGAVFYVRDLERERRSADLIKRIDRLRQIVHDFRARAQAKDAT